MHCLGQILLQATAAAEMVKIAVRGVGVVQEDEGLWDMTVYGKGSPEDKLVHVLVQVFLCSSKTIKSSALPASLCTLAIWIRMPALNKPWGLSAQDLVGSGPLALWHCCIEWWTKWAQAVLCVSGGRWANKDSTKKIEQIICICFGWRYSPFAEICASFSRKEIKGRKRVSATSRQKWGA